MQISLPHPPVTTATMLSGSLKAKDTEGDEKLTSSVPPPRFPGSTSPTGPRIFHTLCVSPAHTAQGLAPSHLHLCRKLTRLLPLLSITSCKMGKRGLWKALMLPAPTEGAWLSKPYTKKERAGAGFCSCARHLCAEGCAAGPHAVHSPVSPSATVRSLIFRSEPVT